mmetsp:Transcript_57332/g.179605  ORF Transcript_57332/g.179605 Transcript_57332/m.179605 type:complete len:286 (-) Transcript_57332:592-1449(-)
MAPRPQARKAVLVLLRLQLGTGGLAQAPIIGCTPTGGSAPAERVVRPAPLPKEARAGVALVHPDELALADDVQEEPVALAQENVPALVADWPLLPHLRALAHDGAAGELRAVRPRGSQARGHLVALQGAIGGPALPPAQQRGEHRAEEARGRAPGLAVPGRGRPRRPGVRAPAVLVGAAGVLPARAADLVAGLVGGPWVPALALRLGLAPRLLRAVLRVWVAGLHAVPPGLAQLCLHELPGTGDAPHAAVHAQHAEALAARTLVEVRVRPRLEPDLLQEPAAAPD